MKKTTSFTAATLLTTLICLTPTQAAASCKSALASALGTIGRFFVSPKDLFVAHPHLRAVQADLEKLEWRHRVRRFPMSNGSTEKVTYWEGTSDQAGGFTVEFTFTPPYSSSNGWPVQASRYGDFSVIARTLPAQRMLEHLAAANLVEPDLANGATQTAELLSSKDLLINVQANFEPDRVEVSFDEDDKGSPTAAEPIETALRAPLMAIRFLLAEPPTSPPQFR